MHPVQGKSFFKPLENPHVAVKVEHSKKNCLKSLNQIEVLKEGVRVMLLPKTISVFDESGHKISPSHNFWITVETIDPYHFVLDMA